MTKITVYKNHYNEFTGFQCIGHAGYVDEGEDIICAGISILVINTINSLEKFTYAEFDLQTEEETGLIQLRFKTSLDSDAEILMKSMILGLEGIQQTYSRKYVTLNIEEV